MHLLMEEMAAFRHLLPAAGDADRRPGCTGGPDGRPRPPLRGQRALPSLEEAGTADLGSSYRSASAADTDLTVPDFVYFDPRDESSVLSGQRALRDKPRALTTSSSSETTQAMTPPPNCMTSPPS